MSKGKQTYNPCDDCQYSYSKNGQESGMCQICEFTYFKDRKQSVGEWLSKHHMSRSPRGRYTSYNTYTCSVCGNANGKRKTPFCPNCGAKMKERIEHE